jgi:N utilization substance protein A
VVVGEDQLSLAIGRDGQNARLAAKLTGWRIDIKSLTEAAGDAIMKLQNDVELAALLPNAVEQVSAVEEVLTKKAENRPVTPEEFEMLGKFVDRVERRTIQIKEEAVRAEGGIAALISAAHPDVPAAAFGMTLDQISLKEHVFNILVEAGYDNVGALMVALKVDADKVLKLPGIGPKAMQNIEESLALVTFPELAPQTQPETAPVAETESKPEATAESAPVAETLVGGKLIQVKKEAKKHAEEAEDDEHKDGVSLDALFAMKPEIFQSAAPTEEEAGDKKKGKKGKKKSVELQFDEERGEVVARKKHKRGNDIYGEDE